MVLEGGYLRGSDIAVVGPFDRDCTLVVHYRLPRWVCLSPEAREGRTRLVVFDSVGN